MAENLEGGSRSAYLRLRIMISTGLVMFVFITMHLTNLALGLISLQLMEDWRPVLSGVWSKPPLKIALQFSLVLHFLTALVSLYQRDTLRVPAYDMAQMIAGILIIPLLALHVFGVMALKELGLEPTYTLVLSHFWVVSPLDGLQQIVMLVVAWIHGAIGVFTWLRARAVTGWGLHAFYPFVVALPILAMLGYVEAGRQIIPVEEGGMGLVLVDDPNADGPTVAQEQIPAIVERAKTREAVAIRVSLAMVILVLLARWARLYRRSTGSVFVTYDGRRTASFEASTGLALLDMARENNLPHASVCRGRGRCGTCRVRVLSGAEILPPPSEMEADVLARWNAEPNERLACQVKPNEGHLVVERVIESDYSNLDYSELTQRGAKPAGVT